MQEPGAFEIEQTVDPDGRLHLALVGDLDHANSHGLLRLLDELRTSGKPVRIDLSRLEFIDSSGVRALLVGVRDAGRENWQVEVDRQLSWQVEQVFGVLGLDGVLWPRGKR